MSTHAQVNDTALKNVIYTLIDGHQKVSGELLRLARRDATIPDKKLIDEFVDHYYIQIKILLYRILT